MYIGNIHPNCSEELLVSTFGEYGQITSVKIMCALGPSVLYVHYESYISIVCKFAVTFLYIFTGATANQYVIIRFENRNPH